MPFMPQRVIFEEAALNYSVAKRLWNQFSSNPKIQLEVIAGKQRIKKTEGKDIIQAHQEAKRTIVVGIRKTLKFQSCKPSAHYQLPLVTGCIGQCEYCYLNTQFGKNPYIYVYVNVEEILEQAEHYLMQRQPDITIFEGAAVSDPIPVESFTGSLAKSIRFFAMHENARFRFVTKFTDVDTLLNIEHHQNTTIRFSINADHIINSYEHVTPALKYRIKAANKVAQAEYPLGFIVGPVILFPDWEQQYRNMFEELKDVLKDYKNISFEVISHRFTARAKKVIEEIYPNNTLPMDEQKRIFKYGQFGYGKYLYPKDDIMLINSFFNEIIKNMFPNSNINYII